jgi:predicted TIM-barrel fold metal-dependent hydrolase
MKSTPALYDLELRFKVMDKFDGLVQVLTMGNPPLESVISPKDAVELAQIANDEMAELLSQHPDQFVGAVACLPMNNLDAALKEIDRTITQLRFKGIQLYTSINGKPLDSPEFRPIYEKMADYNLPIWLHPWKSPSEPDYVGEESSMYKICMTFNWPYQTTLAMSRLVFSGILEDYPNLNFITHHCGGMVPFFAQRIVSFFDTNEVILRGAGFPRVYRRHPIEYFHRFYGDTVTSGSTPALTCGYSFFGADHMLFGTDMPYGSRSGLRQIRDSVEAVERMQISEDDKAKIFEGNARRLLRLPV